MSDLDLGVVGNSAIAALIDRRGRIVWSCFPRLDGDPVFHGLLGASLQGDEGVFEIDLQGYIRSERRYWPNTAILETILEAEDGSKVRIVDFVPRFKMYGRIFRPAMLMRSVEPLVGSPMIKVRIRPSYDYGRERPETTRGSNTIRYHLGNQVLRLTTDGSPGLIRDEVPFILERPLTLILGPDETLPEAPATLFGKFCENTADYWREWVRYLAIPFEWQDVVIRAAITLKLCAYEETGGIVAALTTSIPEYGASGRTWDYRYCWLRDSALTLYALLNGGYREEAEAWRQWLLRAIAGHPDQLRIMYGIKGERWLPEIEIPWLPGYEGSRPVRVGNDASRQIQLDVYGEVIETLHAARVADLAPLSEAWRFQQVLLNPLETLWRSLDHGIWEMRAESRAYTHSRLMCWVAFDRAIKSAEMFSLPAPVERWRRIRDEIHADICAHGYDAQRNTFVQHYGGKALDASLLLIPQVGFLPVGDPRIAGTVRAVESELLHGGLVRRYRTEAVDDGLPGDEGAFLACSFWLADAYVMVGRLDDANRLFERLLSLRNDLGLLSEEYDPVRRRMLGNFPQGFSHVGLVNTAYNLAKAQGPARQRSERQAPQE